MYSPRVYVVAVRVPDHVIGIQRTGLQDAVLDRNSLIMQTFLATVGSEHTGFR